MRVNHFLTEGIVLRSRPFGESDKIVSFLTADYGKITGIAKGAKRSRKRFANSLEPFSLVALRFQEHPYHTLALILTADVVLNFSRFASSLEMISYASYLVEITEGLVGEREANVAVFNHLKEGLGHLNEHGATLRFLTKYELKLLALVGYQPVLDGCQRCRKCCPDDSAERWHFSWKNGGIICASCAAIVKGNVSLGVKAAQVLANLQKERNLTIPELSLPAPVVREIRSVIEGLVQFHVQKEIKSAAFLCRFGAI